MASLLSSPRLPLAVPRVRGSLNTGKCTLSSRSETRYFPKSKPATNSYSASRLGVLFREKSKASLWKHGHEEQQLRPSAESQARAFFSTNRIFPLQRRAASVAGSRAKGRPSAMASLGAEDEETMEGKTVIVTGANTGMGLIIAKELAVRGAKVILACRSEKKGKEAEEKVWREVRARGGKGAAQFASLDLSQLSSVREFADKLKESHDSVDCLINNAGIMVPPHNYTPDGFESQFQVNYLSHYLLTRLLSPALEASKNPKVVNISSLASENIGISNGEFEKIARCKQEEYDAFQAYRQSKLAQVLFTVEMNRRMGESITVNAVHPGIVNTELFSRSDNVVWKALIGSVGWAMEQAGVVYSPERGASTAIHLATSPTAKTSSGGYFADCAPRPANPVAFNSSIAKEWWEKSAQLVGLES